jgi:hypothetical protein
LPQRQKQRAVQLGGSLSLSKDLPDMNHRGGQSLYGIIYKVTRDKVLIVSSLNKFVTTRKTQYA